MCHHAHNTIEGHFDGVRRFVIASTRVRVYQYERSLVGGTVRFSVFAFSVNIAVTSFDRFAFPPFYTLCIVVFFSFRATRSYAQEQPAHHPCTRSHLICSNTPPHMLISRTINDLGFVSVSECKLYLIPGLLSGCYKVLHVFVA